MDLDKLEGIVTRMRALGVRRLRTPEVEIDLADEVLDGTPMAAGASGDDGAERWPKPGARTPHLKKFVEG